MKRFTAGLIIGAALTGTALAIPADHEVRLRDGEIVRVVFDHGTPEDGYCTDYRALPNLRPRLLIEATHIDNCSL